MKTKFLLAIVLGIMMIFTLTGCLSKTAISAEQFKTSMENAGYTVVDGTNQFSDDNLKQLYIAVDPTSSYQLEFYELTTESYAQSSFQLNLNNMEAAKQGSISSSSSLSGLNYDKATQSSNGEYWLVSRVANTFIYAHSSDTNKDAINKAVDALGY